MERKIVLRMKSFCDSLTKKSLTEEHIILILFTNTGTGQLSADLGSSELNWKCQY